MPTYQGIRAFSQLLDSFPVGFTGNRLNLLLLDDAEAIPDGLGFLRQLDDLSLLDERREYLLDEDAPWPFPRMCVEERPDPWVISERLFERFEEAGRVLTRQRDVAEVIDRRVRQDRPGVVALVIVDGLSYYDLPVDPGIQPCLVEGITATEYGYRQVVGKPAVSRRLFALGYAQQMGFTYFPPETNDLAADLHATFGASQITRVRSFDEALRAIRGTRLARAFVQITLAGLDQICHSHFDQPPREHYVQRVMSNYHRLIECLSEQAEHILVVLTADHGILWREDLEGKQQIVDDLFREDLRSPRYVKGSVLRPYGRCCRSEGQNHTLLRVPWMTRNFRNNEWGVHGGISAWESLVPLMVYQS